MARNKKGLSGFLALVFLLVVTISYSLSYYTGYKLDHLDLQIVGEDRSMLLGATIDPDEDQILSFTFNSGVFQDFIRSIFKFTTTSSSQEEKVVEYVKSEPPVVPSSTKETTFEDLTPSQITIVQSDNRQLSRSADFHYPTMTSVINYLYAKKHGYNYVRYQYDNNLSTPTIKTSATTATSSFVRSKDKVEAYKKQQTCAGRSSPWCKILSVYDALTQPQAKDNDLIVFVDSDVAILRPDVSILDYLKEADFVEGRDNYQSPIITAHNYPYKEGTGCSGIFMVRNEEISKEILLRWWTLGTRNPHYLVNHPYEQETWNRYLYNHPKYSSSISVLKDYSFTEEDATLWRHVGTDFDHPHLGARKRRRTFSYMLRKFKKYLKEEDEDGHRIVTKSVIKDIKENHTKLMSM